MMIFSLHVSVDRSVYININIKSNIREYIHLLDISATHLTVCGVNEGHVEETHIASR